MADTWITDITHFLDEEGRIPDLPRPALLLVHYFGSIIEAVTGSGRSNIPYTGVRCRRRPGHRRCKGEILAEQDARTDEIVWQCPVCGDNGRIHNWEDTLWDLGSRGLEVDSADRSASRSEVEPEGLPGTVDFTPEAERFWLGIDPQVRIRLMNNVWCSTCRGLTSIHLVGGSIVGKDLVLRGHCVTCGGEVARLIEAG